jgi:hypothetical protein
MNEEIDRIPVEEILRADAEQLASDLMEKYQVACPVLGEQRLYDEPPFDPGSNTAVVPVYVPFTGNHELFQCTGGYAPVITLPVEVQPTQLVVGMRVERTRTSELPQRVEGLLTQIREGLGHIQQQVKAFNPQLKEWALQKIRQRQAGLASHSNMLKELQQSGFTLRRRNDGNETVVIPVKPKDIAVQRPTASKPEPELSRADYDEILNVIQAMAKVYERSPSVFKRMDEEALRTILLVGLNGLFKGSATGETFNGEGKNDILVRVHDNNIFIAECLFWDGPEHFRTKLTEQLFRYSTWRDSKLAAIVFNRKKDFTAVVQKMKKVVTDLDHKVSEEPYPVETGCRHRFRRGDDPQKQFLLTCLAFEVPS